MVVVMVCSGCRGFGVLWGWVAWLWFGVRVVCVVADGWVCSGCRNCTNGFVLVSENGHGRGVLVRVGCRFCCGTRRRVPTSD